MKDQIILNYLPPSESSAPSAAFSILKSFLQQHNYQVSIKYWVVEIERLTKEIFTNIALGDNMLANKLLPFLCDLALEANDVLCQRKIEAFIQKFVPLPLLTGSILRDASSGIREIFVKQLPGLISGNVLLFGFTSKFDQWIAAIVMAKILKQNYPDIKTVIGGFGSMEAALSAMKITAHFDFAIWGEGEYSLLDLCNQLNASGNFSGIPRLVYREKGQLVVSKAARGNYLDLSEELYPDYDEYFEQVNTGEIDKPVHIPIEGSRGCHWKKCRFCYLNQGYKYRKKSADRLVNEIVHFNKKYPKGRIAFTDNDLVGKNVASFEEFLDKVIGYNRANENNIKLYGLELIPTGLHSNLFKKMALAGIKLVTIGYESASESILEKLDKKNRFADNLLILKFAKKYGIGLTTNSIRNLPDETDEDILESIESIRYLRFWLADDGFEHYHSPLAISSKSRYYKDLVKKGISHWVKNQVYELTPGSLWKNINKYDLMEFYAPVSNSLWGTFEEVDKQYHTTNYSYRLLVNGSVFFEEYYNKILYSEIEFDQPEYWEVLKAANGKVCSLDEIGEILNKKGYEFTNNEMVEIIDNLKKEYILYSNKDYSGIVSIIDTDLAI